MIKYYVIIASVIAILYGAYYAGYSIATDKLLIEKAEEQIAKDAELAKAVAEENKKVQAVQNELYETERAWLEEEAKIKVVYRDKVKTVTETVTEYVKVNDLSKCRIGADGMQLVNEALSRSKENKNK